MPQFYDGAGKYTARILDEDATHIAENTLELIVNSLDEKARTSSMVKCVLDRAREMADCLPVTCASRTNPEEHMK